MLLRPADLWSASSSNVGRERGERIEPDVFDQAIFQKLLHLPLTALPISYRHSAVASRPDRSKDTWHLRHKYDKV